MITDYNKFALETLDKADKELDKLPFRKENMELVKTYLTLVREIQPKVSLETVPVVLNRSRELRRKFTEKFWTSVGGLVPTPHRK